jgi:hypothetical protein
VVDLSIEPPGRNPSCSAAVTSCYFSDHASSSRARLGARSYVTHMSEMRTRASTGSCIASRRLSLESGRALPTTGHVVASANVSISHVAIAPESNRKLRLTRVRRFRFVLATARVTSSLGYHT